MRRTGISREWILAWLVAVPLAVMRAGRLAESDTFWQIRTGELILRTGSLPSTDTFSWTAAGRPWQPNSWGFDLLLGLAYRVGGLTATALTGAVLVLFVQAGLLVLAAHWGATPSAGGLMSFAALLLLMGWLSVRPHLVDFAVIPVMITLTDWALDSPRPRRQWMACLGLAGLAALWVNMHLSASLGIAIVCLVCLVGLVEPGLRQLSARSLVRAALPVAAVVAGALASPVGWGLVHHALMVRSASTGLIEEWLPLDPTSPLSDAFLVTALVALGFALAGRYWRRAAILGALAIGGIMTIRFLPIAVVVAAPALASTLSSRRVLEWAGRHRGMLRIEAAVGIVSSLVMAVMATTHLGQPLVSSNTVRALPSGCRLFNSFYLGGQVILLRPDVPVSLDSRNDLYGQQDVRRMTRILESTAGGVADLEELGVTCALVWDYEGLSEQLADDPMWTKTSSADHAILFVRRVSRG